MRTSNDMQARIELISLLIEEFQSTRMGIIAYLAECYPDEMRAALEEREKTTA